MASITKKALATATTEGNLPKTLTTGAVNLAVGDFVVAVAVDGAGHASYDVMTDTAGNTYTARDQRETELRMYYGTATKANANNAFTVECTGDGYAYPRLMVMVYTIDGYTMSFADGAHGDNYGTALDTPDITSVRANSLWVAGVKASGPRTHSDQTIAGAGATVEAAPDGRIGLFWSVLAAVTTDDAQVTLDSAASWILELLCFDATAVAAGTTLTVKAMLCMDQFGGGGALCAQ